MKKFNFTIRGNQDDQRGNPIPFERAVKGMWRARSTRYMNWQAYVRSEFGKQVDVGGAHLFTSDKAPTKKMLTEGYKVKPFKLDKTKVSVHSKIYFVSKMHGDSDNIQKGIVDALFTQDKYVSGSYDFFYCPNKRGRVEVEIIIHEEVI